MIKIKQKLFDASASTNVWQPLVNWAIDTPTRQLAIACIGGYQRYLSGNDLVSSMSAVGHCGDNAACEGFFGMLKRERVHHRRYRTREEARADLFDYIERFHNPRMRHRVARQDQQFSTFLNRP